MTKWCYLILPLIIFFVSLCDLGTTLYCSYNISDFEEANPIVVYVWDSYGDNGFIVFKLSMTLVSCYCIGSILRYKNRSWRIATWILGLSMCVFLIAWWTFWLFF